MKSPAQDLVRQMRKDGLSDGNARAQLKAQGFTKSRISQLLRAAPPQRKLVEKPARAKKRAPPITLDDSRQLGEASALEAVRQLARNGLRTSARLSCQYLGVSTGPRTYSSTSQILGNSTLVYAWRLTANGMERVATAKKSARCDSIAKYVPLPDELRNALEMESHHEKVQAEVRRALPGTTFHLRLGMPEKLEAPLGSSAPGSAVMLRLPCGRRVEHVLCAHISGDLWYCHAGSPKDGELNLIQPFHRRDLVIRSLACSWHTWQAQRKRLQGRCVKRNLATAAMQNRACFELAVAMARWSAEAYRAKQLGVPMHPAAATAGVDFSEEAFKAAAASPWTSTMLAMWQWAEPAPHADLHSQLCGDVQMCYALRSAPYRHFCSMPRAVLPNEQSM